MAKRLILAAILFGLSACSMPTIGSLGGSNGGNVKAAILGAVPEQVAVNQPTTLTGSFSASKGNIEKVEFLVDGNFQAKTTPPFPQSYFKTDFVWTPPAEGDYAITMKAYTDKGVSGETDVHKIAASSAIIAVATAIKTEATVAPQPTKVIVAGVVACSNDAQLVKEINYPAGTTVQPNTHFQKRWLVKNTGTCDWNSGYYLDLVSGLALGAVKTQLPLVLAGSEVELPLAMVAPDEGGTYQSQWKIHDLQGRPFGATLGVEIIVPSVCKAPVIEYFTASPASIQQGQSSTLSWVVEGAKSVSILHPTTYQQQDLLSTVSATTGTLPVTPDKTTTYTLEAKDGDCVSRRYATVNVSAQPVPAAPGNLQVVSATKDGFALRWQDNSVNEQGFKLYDANTHQVRVVFSANATSGSVYGLNCGYTHSLILRAYNQYGESPDSNVMTHATLPCGN
ncbi:MAG TPA: hypothetical protein G4N96_04955 [Chloroflexi bacterium]|nr:hypothetical protein [Chloroflexota bacterium]